MSKLQVSAISAGVLLCLIIWTIALMHFQPSEDGKDSHGKSGGDHKHHHPETVKKNCCDESINPEHPTQTVVHIAENNQTPSTSFQTGSSTNSTLINNELDKPSKKPCCKKSH